MRRLLILAVALVAVLGLVAPAMAQVPAPKVTISGLIDQIGTYSKNMSQYDSNYNRATDDAAYGRTRGRFDVIGELGKAKTVMGIEVDSYWGQTGGADNNLQGCATNTTSGGFACASQGFGATSAFDLNTDTQGSVEMKWLYTEFPLPLIPIDSTMRLGAQPFGTLATNKLAVYANGDFPGVALVLRPAPAATINLAYVQVEENLTGKRDFLPLSVGPTLSPTGRCTVAGDATTSVTGATAPGCAPQSRGEDWAFIASFEFSPFKGLSIKPMYSYFNAVGLTSGNSRQGRGGVSIAAGGPFAPIGAGFGGFTATSNIPVDGGGTGVIENRHTLGVDASFTSGPFSLQPTVLYQFGDRDNYINLPQYGLIGTKANADISAWLVDVRAGFNVGPLALAGMVMWTSGDSAKSNPFKSISYFQPLDTDTSYSADWGTQIFSLGVDYFNILYANAATLGLNPGVAIGYDKYGRIQLGAKASYAVTPAFTVGTALTANWTDKAVDTDSVLGANSGLLPSQVDRRTGVTKRPEGDSDYLGTEFNLSATYRFAPGLSLDIAGGYLFAGNALGHRLQGAAYSAAAPPVVKDIGVSDVVIGTARVRYSF
jgi:hypothetical protein